ncbi:MAG: carboxypeptidase regulatory-like domain-containing protein [Blastocatellales bacterium]
MRAKIFFLLLIVVCAGTGVAQTTSGSISGTVFDLQQAAVANATVTATEKSKGFILTATTDQEGRFVFPQVAPGTYSIRIEAAAFKKLELTGIVLISNDKLNLGNLALEVGIVGETVTITGEATLIQAESGERSFAVQGEVIRNTGIKSRSFINLATLAPGVVATTSDGTSNSVTDLSINGVRRNSNNVQIDGITSLDVGNNGSNSRVPLDSIGEFKLLTSTYQPEYGRSSGAQIIAVTRSGSQQFHGSAYYYRRHTGLNANTFDNNRNNRSRPISDQTDKGYTIGGPIYIPGIFNTEKKKLFFFWNQEWTPRTSPNTVRNVRVPTELERKGDFSQSRNNAGAIFPYIKDWTLSLPCSASNTSGCFKDGGVLGKIPANRLYAPGLKILSIYPLPNYTPVGNENFNYTSQISSSAKDRNDTIRVDYNLSQNWRIYGRLLNNDASDFNPYTGLFSDSDMIAGNLGIFGLQRSTPKLGFAGTANGSLNLTTVVEITYGFNKANYKGTISDNAYTRTATGLQDLPLVYPDAVVDDILSGFTFGSSFGSGPNFRTGRAPQIYDSRTDDIAGSISKVWGQHNSKIGVFYHWSTKNQTNRVDKNAVINFGESVNNPFDTQVGFANALTGVYQTYTQASSGTTGVYKYKNLEWYVQDNWKVLRRLTLDYGVRFAWMPPARDVNYLASNFDINQYSLSAAPRIYVPVCINGAATCTGGSQTSARRAVDPAILASGVPLTRDNTLLDTLFVGRIVPNSGNVANGLFLAGTGGIPKALTDDQGVLFAPRFGFAIDLTGNNNLILRGGFGIFYDRPQGNLVYDYNSNPPTTLVSVFDFGLLQNISSNTPTITPPSIRAMEPDAKIPSTYAFNLGTQYKLPFDTVLDVSYVGSMGHHLPRYRQINSTPFGSAFLPENQDPTKAKTTNGSNALPDVLYRPYPGYGNIRYAEFAENSNFHSMQLSLNRRFSRGILISANYTWSKALGITSGDESGGVRIDGNDRINYGRQDFDRTHNLVFNWVYELPKFTSNRLIGYAANNWQLSGIYRYTSGSPYTVTCNIVGFSTINLTGSTSDNGARCIINGNPGSGNSSNVVSQFDTSVFQAPNVGSRGLESGRNYMTNAAINNWDLSVSKRIYIRESFRVEARLDAFNALNHTQIAGVNSTATFAAPGSTTINNLASETNRTGFGAATSFRPNRTLQWMLRFEF